MEGDLEEFRGSGARVQALPGVIGCGRSQPDPGVATPQAPRGGRQAPDRAEKHIRPCSDSLVCGRWPTATRAYSVSCFLERACLYGLASAPRGMKIAGVAVRNVSRLTVQKNLDPLARDSGLKNLKVQE